MELSGFFGSINGDRRYRSIRWARYFAKFIGNGVYAREANQLQVVAGEGMQIIVRPGSAFINGYDYENTADLTIDLENADGVLNRIVRVVIQWNLIERKISAKVRYSPFATNPTAPALQRNPDIFELGRADVFIGRGVTRITQSAITDHLLNTSLCGVVRVLDGPLNTDHFDAQLKAWFEEFTEESLREFLDWFNLVKDLLGEDAAGHIMNYIQSELNLIYYIIAPNKLTDIQRTEIEQNADLMAIVNGSIATQAEAEAGTLTRIRNWTPQRIWQAIRNLARNGLSTGLVSSTVELAAGATIVENLGRAMGRINQRVLRTGDSMSGSLDVQSIHGHIGMPGRAGQVEVRGGNNQWSAAAITFHRNNSVNGYAINFGVDTDNQLKIGGWSEPNRAYRIWHDGIFGRPQTAEGVGQVFTIFTTSTTPRVYLPPGGTWLVFTFRILPLSAGGGTHVSIVHAPHQTGVRIQPGGTPQEGASNSGLIGFAWRIT